MGRRPRYHGNEKSYKAVLKLEIAIIFQKAAQNRSRVQEVGRVRRTHDR